MLLPVCITLFVLPLAKTEATYDERDFACRPKSVQIPTTSVCDGVLDCKADGDHSDENENICAPAPYLERDVSLVISEVTNTSLVLPWSKATTKIPNHSLELAGYFVTATSDAHSFQNTVSRRLRTYQVQGLQPWTQYTLIMRPYYSEFGKPESSYKVGRAASVVVRTLPSDATYDERDFACEPGDVRIPTTSVCDGVLDCPSDGDAASDGGLSDENEEICAPPLYLERVVSPVVNEVTNTSLVLSWSKATTKKSSHSLELAGYFVTATSDAHSFQNTVSRRLRTYQVQGLQPWTQYTLIMRPFYSEFGKPESSYKVGRAASVVVRTLPSAPGAPGLVSLLSAQQRNVVLNIVGPSLWNSDALGFHVRWEPTEYGGTSRGELDVSLDENWSPEKNSLNATLPLQGGSDYRVYVSAVGAGTAGAKLKGPELEVQVSVPWALRYQHIGHWVTCYGDDCPPNTVPGGVDGGETTFVGRAIQSGDILPGKVVLSHATCYVPYGGLEHKHTTYQVLVSDGTEFEWISASEGGVPTGALQGGTTKTGERLYIGRVLHNGALTIGKVHPSKKSLFIPYDGKEHSYAKYDVLVCKTVDF